ncbi:lysine N(6)-hydroxylase/L-ornithine N(5)-oxygenase family protein [Streptomyces sp. BE20]|uniref:lysine N(6)-hydroxylase/L-ornithine N(5)-oxygenase family protein n=1 Tax=Streptomyces sp. BE20 TaxID=3002525 RepID=UPI002E7876BE|nr:lysine N(6)-hydroxylase/L-ornithine N(5)-oxygenase family protein [Streptomyces sp. BE20]MEE1824738.1 lysine N(6)-hydroxylase/L-ornithine N(5)-oxygenase family protein [Streptomyces sp. BE20]
MSRENGANYGGGSVDDLVGIGFGPANLALAIAIDDHNRRNPGQSLGVRFLEKQERFGWHRGMLLDGATMQVSFLKDLVTLRDPRSRFTFLSYLQERGRLVDFINLKSFYPTRLEFHDYFEWCAAEFTDQAAYGRKVTAVRPVESDGRIDSVEVVSEAVTGGDQEVRRARNITVGTGLTPRVPDGVTLGERVWHARDLLLQAPTLVGQELRHRRIAVVGAGQSAAEAVEYLHRTFPDAEICAVLSRYGYSPADDSPFANRIFDPAAVDEFYGASEEAKQTLLRYHANTNYSVVDGDLIEQLYRIVYQEKVAGRERLRVLNANRLTGVAQHTDGVRAEVRSLTTNEEQTLDCDAVVLATGYTHVDPRELLGDLAPTLLTDEQGRLRVDRDHRVLTEDHVDVGIYLQGGTEHTHGITSALLSTLAIRSGEICDSLLLRQTGAQLRAQNNRLGVAG